MHSSCQQSLTGGEERLPCLDPRCSSLLRFILDRRGGILCAALSFFYEACDELKMHAGRVLCMGAL